MLGGDRAKVEQVSELVPAGSCGTRSLLHFEGDLYYLRPQGLSLNLRLDGDWLRCATARASIPKRWPTRARPASASVVEVDADYLDARTGFYREQVRRAFDDRALEPFGLSAAEHSAQLTGQPDESAFNKVEEYELRFQDIAARQPPADRRA